MPKAPAGVVPSPSLRWAETPLSPRRANQGPPLSLQQPRARSQKESAPTVDDGFAATTVMSSAADLVVVSSAARLDPHGAADADGYAAWAPSAIAASAAMRC